MLKPTLLALHRTEHTIKIISKTLHHLIRDGEIEIIFRIQHCLIAAVGQAREIVMIEGGAIRVVMIESALEEGGMTEGGTIEVVMMESALEKIVVIEGTIAAG
ncbi:MAG: hypothetical protein IGS50_20985 [Synechococcales cyanobacterium C42_A2020_086]|jgi:hypothetical protein|nr:hypothetical protein [Synechococcales cyanobacterium C42_A2020_086]